MIEKSFTNGFGFFSPLKIGERKCGILENLE